MDVINLVSIFQFLSILSSLVCITFHGDFLNVTCSKFISDAIMVVSSSMAMRDRSSESARFEVLNAEYR